MTLIAEIYQETNSLKDKVSYGSDGVDMATIARAEALIAGMQSEFVAWFHDDMAKLQRRFDAVAAAPVGDRGHLVAEMRVGIQDIKGQGGSFGFPLITNIASTLNRFIDTRSDFGAQELEVVRVHINALRLAVTEGMTGDGGRAGERLLHGLEVVMKVFEDR